MSKIKILAASIVASLLLNAPMIDAAMAGRKGHISNARESTKEKHEKADRQYKTHERGTQTKANKDKNSRASNYSARTTGSASRLKKNP
jgi:hypothetical protein